MTWRISAPLAIAAVLSCLGLPRVTRAVESYTAISPKAGAAPVTLTGHDLTLDQVVQVARYGAQVRLAREARQRSEDAYGLLLEAAVERRAGLLVQPRLGGRPRECHFRR